MKIVSIAILAVLIFLAISSGVTKILLMEQDVVFFAKYGFTNPVLIAYGTIQLIGGFLLLPKKTRFVGAVTVAITFLISMIALLMDGHTPVGIVTAVATLLLGVIAKQSWKSSVFANRG